MGAKDRVSVEDEGVGRRATRGREGGNVEVRAVVVDVGLWGKFSARGGRWVGRTSGQVGFAG